jgi:hypothetical protein
MVKGAYEKYYTEMSPEALLKKEHLEPDEEAMIDSMAEEAAEQFLQKHARNPRIRDRAAGKLAKHTSSTKRFYVRHSCPPQR